MYSWVSMFKNRDYKSISEYGNKVLTTDNIRNILHQIEYMDGRNFKNE